ncbi:putative dihydropyrimidinase [Teladorsagia circumcincta]|uniref:dihydropyrimidinase n=1 Tax=Teladorsagia circumcincta TaxID=45464 RepID=A0A2G9TTU8_TELCI|nr:putative dihydropyrimidinase [Teladorsagia circumcincta]
MLLVVDRLSLIPTLLKPRAGRNPMQVIDVVTSSKDVMWPTMVEFYKQWREWADRTVCCDYALTVSITNWSADVTREMEELVKKCGINSFNFSLTHQGSSALTDEEFHKGLLTCSRLGALARVHAENGAAIAANSAKLLEQGVTGPEGHSQSRPEELEEEATNRACILASQANCPLYVDHVMSKGASKTIANHRQRGRVIFGETIAAALAVDGSHYYDEDWLHAARYVRSPPLSLDPSTPEALMDMLAAGELQTTASDNCTFNAGQKLAGRDDFTKIPDGVNGVEDRMSIVWDRGVHSGKIDPMRFVQITSSNTAKIFNMYPKKGRIDVGSDADLVVWNPNATRTISKNTHHHVSPQSIILLSIII